MVFEGRFTNAAAGLFNKSLAFVLLVLYLMFSAQDTVHALSFHIHAPVPFSGQAEAKTLVKEPFVTEFALSLVFIVSWRRKRRTIVNGARIKLVKMLSIYTRKELRHLLNMLSLFPLSFGKVYVATGARPWGELWASVCSAVARPWVGLWGSVCSTVWNLRKISQTKWRRRKFMKNQPDKTAPSRIYEKNNHAKQCTASVYQQKSH